MDPFALQHAARKRTPWLIALIVLAVVATAAMMGLVLLTVTWILWLSFTSAPFGTEVPSLAAFATRYPPVAIGWFTAAGVFVLGGLVVKFCGLSTGDDLMERLGATRLVRARLSEADDADGAKLRLFNVCEEMAIAAGIDMPSVWVLESAQGVNALAAGEDPSAAAICVTAGTLRYLTRDELQGVVAHEFSHVLNGDMRLNFRLTALISGITLVSRLGRGLLSSLDLTDRDLASFAYRHLTGSRKGGGLPWHLGIVGVLTGAALWVVGSVGELFASLLRCAVAREREFLADAAAAQFTRNPEGLANALRLTCFADVAQRGRALDGNRGDIAHMLFVSADTEFLSAHPPIAERVARLSSRGLAADSALKLRVKEIRANKKLRARASEEAFRRNATRWGAAKRAVQAFAPVTFPPALMAASRRPADAGKLLEELLGVPGPHDVGKMTPGERRALALRCVTTLRDGLPKAEQAGWADRLWDLAAADGTFDSLEIVICASARRHLLGSVPPRLTPGAKLMPTVAAVISTVASFGRHPEEGYRVSGQKLSLFGGGLPPMPEPIGDARDLLAALDALLALAPLAKKELMNALRDVTAEDGEITSEEADYLAAIADAIGAYGWMQSQAAQKPLA